MPLLAKLTGDSDKALARAAIVALGRIGGEEAAKVLSGAKVTADLEQARATSYLACADKMRASGKKSTALAMYREMFAEKNPSRVRAVAFQGIVKIEKGKALPLVIELMKGENHDLRLAAGKTLAKLPGDGVVGALEKEFRSLAPTTKVVVLSSLAARGDKAAHSLVSKTVVRAHSDEVRLAAVKALAALGDASDVPMLAKAAAAGDNLGEAAEKSLSRLSAKDVDRAILKAMASADPNVKVALIRALVERDARATVPALLKAALDKDSDTRKEALRALAHMAEEKNVPAIIDLLKSADSDSEREAIQQAVVTVCKRNEDRDARVRTVMSSMSEAAPNDRASLLRVLGSLGGGKALAAVRIGLKDKDEKVRDAAVRALAEWPDASPAKDLMDLAKNSPNKVHRVLAFRGLIRKVGDDDNIDKPEKIKLYQSAMKIAEDNDRKTLVLGALGKTPHSDALDVVEPYLIEKELQEAAIRAYLNIAKKIQDKYPEKAKAALLKIQPMTDSESIQKQIIENLDKINNKS